LFGLLVHQHLIRRRNHLRQFRTSRKLSFQENWLDDEQNRRMSAITILDGGMGSSTQPEFVLVPCCSLPVSQRG
jgi:hypothetical protein